jgi:septal ring factor EnvC (AmiA/AmiB activator)
VQAMGLRLNLSLAVLKIAILFVVSVLFLSAIYLSQACAQTGELAAKLTKIRAEVVSTEKIIADLKAEFSKLKKDERKLEDEMKRLADEEQHLLERSTAVARQKDKLALDLRAAEQRVSEQQRLISERLKVLYMNTSVSDRSMIFQAAQSGQLERIAVYASALRRSDQARYDTVEKAVVELLETRRTLERTLEEGKSVQDKLRLNRTSLEEKKSKLQVVLQQIQERQQAAKKSLETLTGEAAKLEELMRAIMSAETPQLVAPKEDVEPTPKEPKDSRDDVELVVTPKSIQRAADVMHPGGLFALTAKISYPVTGEIVQKFGKTKVTSFADMIFSKGLEYKTAEGSQVRAVLGGRVAFAGEMPGYDTVVIIDHGERSYSLYGRLGKNLVKQGDLVNRRDVVGVTAQGDSKGRNFYFETRKNGAPVDPVSVLSRAG